MTLASVKFEMKTIQENNRVSDSHFPKRPFFMYVKKNDFFKGILQKVTICYTKT